MTESLLLYTAIFAIFVLAGLVKGVIGLGLPTVAIGLLTLFMLPAEAASLMIVPSLLTNIWQALAGPNLRALLARLWPMLVMMLAATFLSSGLIASGNAAAISVGLGVALLLYAVAGLLRIRLDVAPGVEPWAGPLAGAATGVVTGATGIFVIPAAPFIAGLGLSRDDLVQALGLHFLVATAALGAGLAWQGALQPSAAAASALAVLPALLGMMAGGWLRKRVRPESFRRWFFVGLAVLGLQIAIQALTSL